MDYEKAYKEARKRAKSAIEECGNNQGRITMIESIFPELKEGEDERDQKIKREVIEMLHYYHAKSPCFAPPQFSLEETLAWLEKQGEKDKTNAVPNSQSEDEEIREEIIENIRQEIELECTLSEDKGNRWIAWLETHKYTEEDLDKAYKCADKVQYTSGYNDAKEEIEQKLDWSEKFIAEVFEKVGLAKIVREQGNDELTNAVQMAMIELGKQC